MTPGSISGVPSECDARGCDNDAEHVVRIDGDDDRYACKLHAKKHYFGNDDATQVEKLTEEFTDAEIITDGGRDRVDRDIYLNETDRVLLPHLREGRITPVLGCALIEEDGKDVSRPYVQQRLKRLEEHGYLENLCDKGVYELVEDPESEGENEGKQLLPDGGVEDESQDDTDVDGILEAIDTEAWVLEHVDAVRVREGEPWSSRRHLVREARKGDDVDADGVERAIDRLLDEDKLLSWHGLLVPVEAERLRETLRFEAEQHDRVRSLLIGKLNAALASVEDEDEGEREGSLGDGDHDVHGGDES